jgi:hypothetical protein
MKCRCLTAIANSDGFYFPGKMDRVIWDTHMREVLIIFLGILL